ncbi:MAG TPA: single-stranded-DNA-specific exonuclease RecJ, partial [Flavisolibacter sp.]|nr:single-stranded-DNA-specific exonuclease RecJ [Flavisolibacter sp.]
MEKRWRLKSFSKEKAGALFKDLKIHPVLCGILVQRGIETFEQAKQFFRPQLSELYDPFLLKDMDKATDRILKGIQD